MKCTAGNLSDADNVAQTLVNHPQDVQTEITIMFNNRQKLVMLAAALLTMSSSAFADWQNGSGVIRWGSTDKTKIIYWSNVNPYNGERSLSTSATDYNTYKDTSKYADRNKVPAGYSPGLNWETTGALFSTLVEAKSKLVWMNVAVSAPQSCGAGKLCGEHSMTVSKDQCSSHDFGLGLSGSGITWTKAKFKYLETFLHIISGSASTGFSTCTGSSDTYTCYAGGDGTPGGTDTYATVETRAKWGYGRFTPDNGEIVEGSDGKSVKNICAAAGGSYHWDTFDGTSWCSGVKNKVYWEKYQLIPISSATTNTCRVVKAGA